MAEDEFPRCSMCSERMSFYGQLDSLNNTEFDLADAGLVAVFGCFDCFQTQPILVSMDRLELTVGVGGLAILNTQAELLPNSH